MQIRSIVAIIVVIALFYITATAQRDNEVYETIQVKQLEFSNVSDVKWSPDGTRLAIVAYPSIHIFDRTTWDTTLVVPDAHVNAVVWNSDGSQIASVAGGNPGSLFIRDANTGEVIRHLTRSYPEFSDGVVLPMFTLSWSPDNRLIASDSPALDVLLWDLDAEEVTVLGSHDSGRVGETDWSPDSNRVVSDGADGTIRIWNAENGEQLLTIQGGGFVDWHPTDNKILGGGDGFAFVWDATSGEQLLRIEHDEPSLVVRWNHDGSLIATGGLRGIIKVWEGRLGTQIDTVDEHAEEIITMLAWHPIQNLLASASLDGRVVVWQFNK